MNYRVCENAGVAVGTGVGASRRGSGLGRVGRVWARAGVWACGSKFNFLQKKCFLYLLVERVYEQRPHDMSTT